jgi:deoxycytidylate deaminase
MIINSGIVTVIFKDGYGDDLSKEMLREAGIEIIEL